MRNPVVVNLSGHDRFEVEWSAVRLGAVVVTVNDQVALIGDPDAIRAAGWSIVAMAEEADPHPAATGRPGSKRMTEPDPRISAIFLLNEDGVTPDEALAMLLQHLADRIETDPVTSWTADDIYAGLARLANVAEQKRRDVEVVRAGRPPKT